MTAGARAQGRGLSELDRQRLAAIRDRAKSLHQQGRLGESLDAHDEALKLAPNSAVIWLSAARVANQLGEQEVSLRRFERAAQLDPTCFEAVESVRRLCVGFGLELKARNYSRLSYDLKPVTETAMALKLIVPSIARSSDEILEVRRRYEAGLDELLSSTQRLDQPDGILGISAFFLAYHGMNDLKLQIKAARMFLKLIPSLSMTAPHCAARSRREGRIRIGFISRFFSRHSIFLTSRGLVANLSRDLFEVWVLRITPSCEDDATAEICGAADHAVALDPDFHLAREQIAILQLDILFFQDIGMDLTSYFLAFARLAPVQCVSFGHPNTTGIPTVDFFISNDLYETEESGSHYSERLVLLHDLPTLAYYYRPVVEPGQFRRSAFGLPDEATLYVCPQTLYKVHPDFDRLIGGILRRDPKGLALFIEGQAPEFTDQLRDRLAVAMPDLVTRVRFLPRMAKQRYLALLASADVVLDTVHFNGMNSSLETFAVGTPVVTLPTMLQRGRHTLAMYRKMNILDCIACDPESYIEIAVRVGTDRNYADDLRGRIRGRSHVLFEDTRVIEQFESFFLKAHRLQWEEHT